jgi:VWFA-related protein
MFIFRLSSILAATALVATTFAVSVGAGAIAQSGNGAASGRRTATLNVIVHAPKDKTVTKEVFDLYDAGIAQEVDTFRAIETGAHVVLLVDNTANLKAESPAIQKAALSVVNELFQDDEMMVVGYNESAEIIQDMTGNLAKLQISASKFGRKGFPRLFDALIAVSDAFAHQAQTGVEKRAIILVSDGYDSDSQTKFGAALNALQDENIILYAIQVADRTHGALLREKPKPPSVLEKLTKATGGAIFSFEKAEDAAKTIADDLRNKWYSLTYVPTGVSTINNRNILLITHDPAVELRTKGFQPGRYRGIGMQ